MLRMQKLLLRLLIPPFAAFILCASANQNTAPASSRSDANNDLIVSLLEQSHNLDQQFGLAVHLDLLARQTSMISRILGDRSRDLARQWANELFSDAAQTKQPRRSNLQGSALTILARLDPQHALELLHTAQLEETGPPSPKMQLAGVAFNSLIESGGESALPLIEQEADQLGAQGQYPYAALGRATYYAVSKEFRDNRQHATDVLRSVFEPAFARYSQGPPNFSSDYEFGEMLRVMAGAPPIDATQPALRALVKNLLAVDTNKYHYQARAVSPDGEDFHPENAGDAAILWFAQLINRDPQLVQEVETARPGLQSALECFKANRCRGMMFGRGGQQSPRAVVPDPQAETREAAVRFSLMDPEAAIAKVGTLSDSDIRTESELNLARRLARSHPDQAAQLTSGAQSTPADDDPRKQLNVISAQVSIAAAQNQQQQLLQLLQRGFELAGPLVAQPLPPGAPPFIPGLPPMIQIAIQNYPDMTVKFLEGLPPERMKAELLIGAAAALQMPQRLPTK